jgi:hypothetical protein
LINPDLRRTDVYSGEQRMRNCQTRLLGTALALLVACGIAPPSKAETGEVRVDFTKGGFIVGVGGGHGALFFRGHRYPFEVSGMSVGFTIGSSRANLVGRARNLRTPNDIAGHYSLIGAGAAAAGGAGGVLLRNENGVVLELAGGKIGVELSAAVGGVTVALR